MSKNILQSVADRLGFQEEPKVIKKAEELLRVMNSKITSNKLKVFTQTVLCLDIASSLLGLPIDKEAALTLSGLKKNVYQNNLNMLEKVLDIDKPITIKEICVQHSCTVVQELSERILKSYQEHSPISDFTHPQYVAVSVYTACKLKNVKVERSKFVSISHLKATQWKELEVKFERFVETLGLNANKPKKSTKNDLHEFLETQVASSANAEISPRKKQETIDEEIENYDVWKSRILKAAKESLNI